MTARTAPAIPHLRHERALSKLHGGLVAGVDEAGRGPWAGPVVAAAVIFENRRVPKGINDSKALSAEQRERLAAEIQACAYIGIGVASVTVIDEINILRASLRAMRDAIAALPVQPAAALIDGRDDPAAACPATPLTGGDAVSVSVAAASIIAKVTRDRMMLELAAECPGYGWERNKGYGTPEHGTALARLGASVHHRRSFAPVRVYLPQI